MVPKQITLSRAIEGYFLAAQARRLSPHTLSDYNYTFTKLEAFLGNDPPIVDITVDHIRHFLNSQSHLSAKTILNYHVGLSSLWTWAVQEGIVDHHIVRDIRPPKPEKKEIHPYTKRDLQAMLTACDWSQPYTRPGKRKCTNKRWSALRDRAIITLLVDTGIRASELCDLRLRDADLENQRIIVMGKGRKQRIIPISPRTARVVWRYLATRDEHRSNGPLFLTREGRQMNRFALLGLIRRIGDRAGVPGANIHRFRHTFAIALLRNGSNTFALQRMLGHSTLDMVERYLRIVQADIDDAHRDASPVSNWML